jgi:hypothetical protein
MSYHCISKFQLHTSFRVQLPNLSNAVTYGCQSLITRIISNALNSEMSVFGKADMRYFEMRLVEQRLSNSVKEMCYEAHVRCLSPVEYN